MPRQSGATPPDRRGRVAAGVSIATASRALSGTPGVSRVGRRAGAQRRRGARLRRQHARAVAGRRHHSARSGWWSTRSATRTSPRSPAACCGSPPSEELDGPDLPHRPGPGDRAASDAHPGGQPGRRDPDRRIGVRRPARSRRRSQATSCGATPRSGGRVAVIGRHHLRRRRRAARQHRGRPADRRARAVGLGHRRIAVAVRLARADHGRRPAGRRRTRRCGRPASTSTTSRSSRPSSPATAAGPAPSRILDEHPDVTAVDGAERRHGDRRAVRAAAGPDRGAGPDVGDRLRRRRGRRRPGARPDHDPAADVRHGRARRWRWRSRSRAPAPEAAGRRRARGARLVRPRPGAERRYAGRRSPPTSSRGR